MTKQISESTLEWCDEKARADGHEAIEEAMFRVTTEEARGLPGYRRPGA
jgi:hypothetical protein